MGLYDDMAQALSLQRVSKGGTAAAGVLVLIVIIRTAA